MRAGRGIGPDHVIHPNCNLEDAARSIDRNRCGAVCITDDRNHLLGVLTDGDLRRQVLRGMALDQVMVTEVMQRRPITATADFSAAQLRHLMKARSIAQIPIVDRENHLVALALAADLLEAPARGRQALIMAGGRGLRLRPLTADRPKPLLPIGGRPILEHIIERLVASGFDQLHLSVGYRSGMIEDHIQDGSHLGANVSYIREDQALGTAGALSRISLEGVDDLLVMNGDILTTLDFAALLESHKAAGADMTVAVREIVERLEYGVLRVEDEWVRDLVEKPRRSTLINAGIYIVGRRMRELCPASGPYDMTELIQWGLAENCRLKSYPIREFWLDIGHHGDYEAVRNGAADAYRDTMNAARDEPIRKEEHDTLV
jgi:dTDP-glucose pyrophosphorylase